ncbi:PREDICTED: regulator of microtubule dynamics protein 1-like isoform X3 [Priapulus caudatus]|uniref:Regulator of microtubule dynamics protein 1 n=1 Tax=Priapulus caudatus TaxID=37621 RepID=A0ABM1F4M9_PRICU|nr:PREDICTED: regulator of microtubule dynamics protein 1-like isoform X3 [Priapulus caudatus]
MLLRRIICTVRKTPLRIKYRVYNNPLTWAMICGVGRNFFNGNLGRFAIPSFLAFTTIVYAQQPDKKVDDEIVEMADNLYDHHEVDKLYEFLSQYKDSKNDEIQWRLARAASDKSKKETDETKKKELTYEGLHHAEIAVKLNENNFAAHKWYAAQLAYVGFYGNFKIQIQNSYIVRDHFGKAIALNPQDATSIHSLGYWCFVFADMPWYQRKIASMLFATPPTSTYEEALKYFLDAENVDPNFYSMNLTMLGKTYMRIGNKKMALLYLSKAHEYPVKTEDDKDAHKEAGELLASLGVKS